MHFRQKIMNHSLYKPNMDKVIFMHHGSGIVRSAAMVVAHILLPFVSSFRKVKIGLHPCFIRAVPFVLFGFMITLGGCAGFMKDYGYYVPDTEVTKMFAAWEQSPHYQYYYCGPQSGPTAILGVHKDYVLTGDLWQSIPDDGEAFANLLGDMGNATLRIGQTPRGYKLYDPDGIILGVWYAIFSATPVIHMQGENRLAVYGPHADLYRRDGRDLFFSSPR